MKKIVQLCSPIAVVALLLWAQVTNAQKKYEFSHERTVSQTYPAGSGDRLKIENKFGDIVVRTWNRNEVKVDVRIAVSANVKETAADIFENIEVEHGKKGNEISFETNLNAKDKKSKNGKSKSSMTINYDVSMPASLALSIDNQFGNSTIPDLTGPVNIDQQFGTLVAGKLSKAGKIEVKFGGAVIESAVNGDFDFQFSEEVAINELSGKANIDVKFCKKKSVVINANNIESLVLDAQYSEVAVVVPRNISAGFNIDTHFGSFKNESSFAIKEETNEDDDDDDGNRRKHRGPEFTHSYKGKAGSGNVRINLDANFSDIIITHDVQAARAKKKKETKI